MFKILKTIILLVIIVVILAVSKDFVIKQAAIKGTKSITGLDLKMGKLHANVSGSSLLIKDLVLYNPDNFKDRIMISIPEVYIDMEPKAILKGKYHIEEMRLNLGHFTVVKNEQGQLNLESLKPAQSADKSPSQKDPQQEKTDKVAPEFTIDHLLLKFVGKVEYRDYSNPGDPVVKEYDVDYYEKFEDIDNVQEFIGLVVKKVLLKTSIGNFVSFDAGEFKDQAMKSLADQANSLKEKFNLPFGK